MKKGRKDKLREEYGGKVLSTGIRGKYLRAYWAGTNLVLLEPLVAAAFPTDKSVNDALRSLIDVAERAIAGHHSRSRRRHS